MSQGHPVERAFELARSGQFRSVEDIRRQLRAEQYENVDSHTGGATIKRQLIEAMKLLD